MIKYSEELLYIANSHCHYKRNSEIFNKVFYHKNFQDIYTQMLIKQNKLIEEMRDYSTVYNGCLLKKHQLDVKEGVTKLDFIIDNTSFFGHIINRYGIVNSHFCSALELRLIPHETFYYECIGKDIKNLVDFEEINQLNLTLSYSLKDQKEINYLCYCINKNTSTSTFDNSFISIERNNKIIDLIKINDFIVKQNSNGNIIVKKIEEEHPLHYIFDKLKKIDLKNTVKFGHTTPEIADFMMLNHDSMYFDKYNKNYDKNIFQQLKNFHII